MAGPTTTSSEGPSSPMAAGSRPAGPTPSWIKGIAFCAFTANELLSLSERLQRFLGPLACRAVKADQLFTHAPPRDGEILLLPLRHNADPSLIWVHELRQKHIHCPVLFIRSAVDFIPTLPLDSLGAVDFLAFDNASDFDLWRSLGLLRRAHQRELAHLEMTGDLESTQTELVRRRDEVGFLTLSLAGREIDEELIGDRIEERALTQVRKRIQRSERFSTPLTGFLIGIDDIKDIKMLCGSAFAAFVLVQVAYRLKRVLRENEFLWRFGEEGFLLLAQETTAESVRLHAKQLMDAVSTAPLENGGHVVVPSISIGAARYRSDMSTSGELIAVAKLALEAARGQGKGGFALT